ncbi:hypothetical protein [Paenibacillus terrae]|uniref:hypothetical protein n=1 Tax=Paenibacillus terrae TaxID=159743 RepID=UPI000A5D8BED|nr:hypothetical protein [Paenibacillus terrae]
MASDRVQVLEGDVMDPGSLINLNKQRILLQSYKKLTSGRAATFETKIYRNHL